MEIVADSAPLISCARADKLSLIRDIYSKIVIPPAVYREIVIEGAGKPYALYSMLKQISANLR